MAAHNAAATTFGAGSAACCPPGGHIGREGEDLRLETRKTTGCGCRQGTWQEEVGA